MELRVRYAELLPNGGHSDGDFRIDPVNDAGIFVIAYAIGNLMLTIGRYGIRQFQASDVVEKYSYREYYIPGF